MKYLVKAYKCIAYEYITGENQFGISTKKLESDKTKPVYQDIVEAEDKEKAVDAWLEFKGWRGLIATKESLANNGWVFEVLDEDEIAVKIESKKATKINSRKFLFRVTTRDRENKLKGSQQVEGKEGELEKDIYKSEFVQTIIKTGYTVNIRKLHEII